MTKIRTNNEEKEWDKYWTKKQTTSQSIYRIIASFYREFIIRGTLNYFINKEFKKNDILLHARVEAQRVQRGQLGTHKGG